MQQMVHILSIQVAVLMCVCVCVCVCVVYALTKTYNITPKSFLVSFVISPQTHIWYER